MFLNVRSPDEEEHGEYDNFVMLSPEEALEWMHTCYSLTRREKEVTHIFYGMPPISQPFCEMWMRMCRKKENEDGG